ncbi:hypothetical protein HY086_03510 [Candidatus Gottesmanbacteria bacterium]|nr:hypothetical protein [Candidatus Gottesmanbacteria bacterium]
MLTTVIVLLAILWLLGVIHIPAISIQDMTLFVFNGHRITLLNVLTFLVIAWAIEMLPSPLRQIAVVLILLWVLSVLGFLAISGLSHLIVLAIIIGLILTLFQG